MIEVEIKLPIPGNEKVEEKLFILGFETLSELEERDRYLDVETGQIRNGGEALRVRTVRDLSTGQETSCITYKGRKLDFISMARRELETKVEDGEVVLELFAAIGYHCVEPEVRKTRKEYKKGKITACVDRVKGLGDFLELEIVMEEPENTDTDAAREEALAILVDLLEQLGHKMQETTTRSYLSMLQNGENLMKKEGGSLL